MAIVSSLINRLISFVINNCKGTGNIAESNQNLYENGLPLEAVQLLDHLEQILSEKIEELCETQNMKMNIKEQLNDEHTVW